ncbi:MAG TPA: phosphatase PAP2 family protein [Anaerolineae bacterium]|nr:phosphatase PAP2 family protein [Anaerolineae bacterium]
MESILDWGIPVILWFQQFSPALDLPFTFFSLLGEETFFLLFLPGLYWSVDRRVGARLTLLFLLSACLNFAAKAWADQPRPFEYDVHVRQLVEVPVGGLPSGHAQNAVVVWVYLAVQFRRAWLWWMAGLLIIFISLSRLYLGVHFPTDLLGGYLLGGALLVAYLRLEPGLEVWLQAQGLIWQLGLALIASCLPLFLATEEGVAISAVILGMSLGLILERRLVCFEADGSWQQRVLRFLVGAAVMVALWLGLRPAFSGLEPALLFRFIRYGLLGLWGAFGAPWLFVKLSWAEKSLGKQSTPLTKFP